MCIVFVLDGIFRPENSYRNTNTRQTQKQLKCIVLVLDGRFRPEFSGPKKIYDRHNSNKYVLSIVFVLEEYSGRKIPARI